MHKVPKVAHVMYGVSVCNLHHVIPQTPTVFKWLLDLCKICSPLVYTENYNE